MEYIAKIDSGKLVDCEKLKKSISGDLFLVDVYNSCIGVKWRSSEYLQDFLVCVDREKVYVLDNLNCSERLDDLLLLIDDFINNEIGIGLIWEEM